MYNAIVAVHKLTLNIHTKCRHLFGYKQYICSRGVVNLLLIESTDDEHQFLD